MLTGVGDGDEAGAVEEAVPGVPPPCLVVGVHRHRRPRQQAVGTGAAAGALDGAAVALGAGKLQVALQRRSLCRRLGDAPGLRRLRRRKVMLVWMLRMIKRRFTLPFCDCAVTVVPLLLLLLNE